MNARARKFGEENKQLASIDNPCPPRVRRVSYRTWKMSGLAVATLMVVGARVGMLIEAAH